ncbi:MAG: hypothetical protein PHN56_05175 [Candidatus Nanoarchaeia archaeon]|nr:hypothetical protein [Candidatus Nanoarchaeia archaeon]
MKNTLISIILVVLILGCTSNNSIQDSNEQELTNIDFEILPFQGLEYNGQSGDYEAFYAFNDSSYAIYVENYIYSAFSFENAMQIFREKFEGYENFACEEVSSNGWLTNAQIFECTYYSINENASYKSAVFYKNNEFIHTMLSVWGQSLNNYETIFDEFNQKAINWG